MIKETIFPHYISDEDCRFTVWAPKAKNIEVVLMPDKCIIPLNKNKFDYWTTDIKNIEPGTHYKYRINNQDIFPDPTSLSQPNGVHGNSQIINLKSFNWTDKDWMGIPLEDSIQYEIHTGTFTKNGTFEGIIEKLDYLNELGINTIEILPVAQFSGERNWGYDGVYPFAVHDSYGGAFELMKLVNACHEKNIAVILDVVYNHFGPEGNYVSNFGHYFSGKYSTPWGDPINFDDKYSDGVRNFVIQNALMWLRDFHVDGLRLDAVHSIFDFSAKHILQELAENVEVLQKETKKTYHLIAESHLNDVRYISPVKKGGYNLSGQWSDDFHHTIHAVTTGERKGYYQDFDNITYIAKALKDAFVFDGKYSEYRKKTYGNSTSENDGKQFVIFNQNHDQVGNRKFGERLISLTDFETAKLVAGTMFIAPNIPMLFMGEEYAERNPFLYFVSHASAELNKLVKKGRENEFKDFYTEYKDAPDPASTETFNQSKLSWAIDENVEKKSMFDYYKRLISYRKKSLVLKLPNKNNITVSVNQDIIIVERWNKKHVVYCFLNFSSRTKTATFSSQHAESISLVLDSSASKWSGPGSSVPKRVTREHQIQLNGKSIVIFSNEQIL